MRVLVRRLRIKGARLPPAAIESTQWTQGVLCMAHQHGARCLGVRGATASPDRPPLACLYAPTVSNVENERLVVRGVERVEEKNGVVLAVIQEWEIRHRPSLGPMGLLAPEAKERRSDFAPLTLASAPGGDNS
jgi:hypothetical protein